MTVVSFEWRVDDVLTDVDSAVLSDAGDNFGVRRVDNQAIVVAAGQELDHVSTGVYEYEFEDPSAGLQYEYWVRIVHDGSTHHVQGYINSDDQTPVVAGRYASYEGLVAKYGEISVQKWARVNGEDQSAANAAITKAIEIADAKVDSNLKGGPYKVPFTAPISPIIRDIANLLAGVHLYEAQGIIDFSPETGQPFHRFTAHKKTAMKDLARLKTGRMNLYLDDGSFVERTTEAPEAGAIESDTCDVAT